MANIKSIKYLSQDELRRLLKTNIYHKEGQAMRIQTQCLQCGETLVIHATLGGEGYFFGYDTDFYSDGIDDQRDPHEIVGYFCKQCGSQLRAKARTIGEKILVD